MKKDSQQQSPNVKLDQPKKGDAILIILNNYCLQQLKTITFIIQRCGKRAAEALF